MIRNVSHSLNDTVTFLFAAVLEDEVDRSVDVLLAGRGCEVHSRDLELCHTGRRPFLETSTNTLNTGNTGFLQW